jgi:hypothetical protein
MSFASIISIEDRRRLRHIVRKVHLSHYPADKLTNVECDKLIDAWGPEVVSDIIRKTMNAGQIA